MSNRRKFIKTIGAGTATLAIQPAFANLIVPRQKVLGVALVGLGYYSRDLLAPALRQTKHCKLAETFVAQKLLIFRRHTDRGRIEAASCL